MRIKVILIIILFYFVNGDYLYPQQIHREWVSSFNGQDNADDYSLRIENDNNGNIYVFGNTSLSVGRRHLVLKYSNDGNLLWSYVNNDSTYVHHDPGSFVLDELGNIYLTGYAGYSGQVLKEMVTIKLDANGNEQWVTKYYNPSVLYSYGREIAISNDGFIYVMAETRGYLQPTNYALIKYNTDGELLWDSFYDGPDSYDDYPYDMAIDVNNNIYLTGFSTRDNVNGARDYITVKFNENGDTVWSRRYNNDSNTNDYGEAVIVDDAGNVYVSGNSDRNEFIGFINTIKYSPDGNEEWIDSFNFPGSHLMWVKDMIMSNDGSFYVGGTFGIGINASFITIKYDTAGSRVWERIVLGERGSNTSHRIITDSYGNVYIGGKLRLPGSPIYSFTAIKYSSVGDSIWAITSNEGIDGPSFIKSDMCLDDNMNLYVTRTVMADIIIEKYSQTTGINNIQGELPSKFSLSQNYPNPFNPSTKIKFEVPALQNTGKNLIQLKIYNTQGQEVAVLVNRELTPGIYEAEWDAGSFPSGIYFYKLSASGGTEDFQQTRKMILIK